MQSWSEELEDLLRRRILTSFHRGGLARGDRLPSIRRLSRELARDHRSIARAYRALEQEGLVEVRPRSGVYLTGHELLAEGPSLVPETAMWLSELLSEAWQRGMSPLDLRTTLERAVRPERMRVACVESVRDPLYALAAGVDAALGLECRRFLLSGDAPDAIRDPGLDLTAEAPDLVVTTVLHAGIRRRLEEAGVPLILLRINPEWVAVLRKWARRAPLVILVDDPGAASRFRELVGADTPIRVLSLERLSSGERPARDEIVYATDLARSRLEGRWLRRARTVGEPLLDPRTIRELMSLLVGTSLRS